MCITNTTEDGTGLAMLHQPAQGSTDIVVVLNGQRVVRRYHQSTTTPVLAECWQVCKFWRYHG